MLWKRCSAEDADVGNESCLDERDIPIRWRIGSVRFCCELCVHCYILMVAFTRRRSARPRPNPQHAWRSIAAHLRGGAKPGGSRQRQSLRCSIHLGAMLRNFYETACQRAFSVLQTGEFAPHRIQYLQCSSVLKIQASGSYIQLQRWNICRCVCFLQHPPFSQHMIGGGFAASS